jgi:hypothetical protein
MEEMRPDGGICRAGDGNILERYVRWLAAFDAVVETEFLTSVDSFDDNLLPLVDAESRRDRHIGSDFKTKIVKGGAPHAMKFNGIRVVVWRSFRGR